MKSSIRALAVFGWLACAVVAVGVDAQEKYPSRPTTSSARGGPGAAPTRWRDSSGR